MCATLPLLSQTLLFTCIVALRIASLVIDHFMGS